MDKIFSILIVLFFGNSMELPYNKTMTDLQVFLAADKTNEILSDDLDCTEYSESLINGARLRGFKAVAYIVTWKNDPVPHEFVAFDTIDAGIVMIEPQNDLQYFFVNSELCDSEGDCWNGEKLDSLWSYWYADNQTFPDAYSKVKFIRAFP